MNAEEQKQRWEGVVIGLATAIWGGIDWRTVKVEQVQERRRAYEVVVPQRDNIEGYAWFYEDTSPPLFIECETEQIELLRIARAGGPHVGDVYAIGYGPKSNTVLYTMV